MALKIVKYDKYLIPSVTTLLQDCFPKKNCINQDVVNWKYELNPNPNLFSYEAVTRSGAIASHYCNLEIPVIYNNKILKSLICLDMATLPEFRRMGLISQLSALVYKDVVKNQFDFSFGFSNEEGINIDIYAKNYNYEIIGPFSTFLAPTFINIQSQLNFEKVSKFPSEKTFNPYPGFSICKSDRYLTWRYIQKPGNNYHIFKITQGNVCLAYIIMRFNHIFSEILDIILCVKTDITKIIQTGKEISKKFNKPFQLVSVLENKFWSQTLYGQGFYQWPYSKHRHYLTVRNHKPKASWSRSIINPEKWWLMGGDIL